MPTPQSGILPEANSQALFITLGINPGINALAHASVMLKEIPALTRALAGQHADARLSSVAALGAGAWHAVTGQAAPAELRDYQPRICGLNKLPATPADILLHIRSERRDLNFELARQILAVAGKGVRLVEEVPGFRYLDARDLTGFVDGTENPEGDERSEVALVGAEDPAGQGGSYVILQRYVHNLALWKTLNQDQQEQVIGRTRDTDEELADEIRPDSAHISRVVIEDDGEELEILRHSLPYGDSTEAGLMFIAYSARREIFDLMLDRMFDAERQGVHDHLMDYTRAETGAYFFAPAVEVLEQLAQE